MVPRGATGEMRWTPRTISSPGILYPRCPPPTPAVYELYLHPLAPGLAKWVVLALSGPNTPHAYGRKPPVGCHRGRPGRSIHA